jgi:hypothetical protein
MTSGQWSVISGQLSKWKAASCPLPAGSLLLLATTSTAVAAPITGDEFVIEGEVLKPEITVVISRENLNKAYELKLDENLLEMIVESVQHAPF